MACPYHAAADHVLGMVKKFGAEIIDDVDFPLFPTAGGGTASKDAVVRTVEQLATKLGQPVLADDGGRLFGGHSFRVSGARWLASKGVPLEQLQVLARWESDVVKRYVGDSVLAGLTAHTRAQVLGEPAAQLRVGGHDYQVVRTEVSGRSVARGKQVDADIQVQLQELREIVKRVDQETSTTALQRVHEMETQLVVMAGEHMDMANQLRFLQTPQYVENIVTGMTHRVEIYGVHLPQATWRTPCGWGFGRRSHFRLIAKDEAELATARCRCMRQ